MMKKLIHIEPASSDELQSAKIYTSLDGYTKADEHPIVAFIRGSSAPISLGSLLLEMIWTENRLGRPLETIFSISSKPLVEISTNFAPKVWIARLRNGSWLVSDLSSDLLSLVKDEIEVLFEYGQLEKDLKTQFLSFFTHVVALLLESQDSELELEEIHSHIIPSIHTPLVTQINREKITTNLKLSSLKTKYDLGDVVRLQVGNDIHDLMLVKERLWDEKMGQIFVDNRGLIEDPYLSFVSHSKAIIHIGDEIKV